MQRLKGSCVLFNKEARTKAIGFIHSWRITYVLSGTRTAEARHCGVCFKDDVKGPADTMHPVYPCHRQQWLVYLWLAEMNSFFYFCTSIYKEELKTIVRKLLACMQPNHREAFTVLWNPYRRVSSRGATCANMLQPRSVQQKTRKWLSVILVLRGSIWTFVFNNTTTTHATPRLPNASASYV